MASKNVKTEKTVIYCRAVKQNVDLLSKNNRLTEYAKGKGYNITKFYSDIERTGSIKERSIYRGILEDARAGRIQRILVWSISDFARDINCFNEFLKEMKELGVEIETVAEGDLQNESEDLIQIHDFLLEQLSNREDKADEAGVCPQCGDSELTYGALNCEMKAMDTIGRAKIAALKALSGTTLFFQSIS